MNKIITALIGEFSLSQRDAENIIDLIDDGNTIPFIARYRKEMTGGIDDQRLREFADRLAYLRNLEARRQEVMDSILEQDKLTDEISAALDAAVTLSEIEDIYRPFRPKRRTRATIAREKGLEGLAEILFAQNIMQGTADELAEPYADPEKGVNNTQEALQGAMDIIAEEISDNAELRKRLRTLILRDGILISKANTPDDSVYRTYYDYQEKIDKIANHRILAINRGEREKFLKVSISCPEGLALGMIERTNFRGDSVTTSLVRQSGEDAWKRLIFPSIENEVRAMLKERADTQAISSFALNLRGLLMQPPVKGKTVLGFDPAYRTGCKLAAVDETGKVLITDVIYPTPPQNKTQEARSTLKKMIDRYGIEVIAIGNGTASKESEIFIADLLKEVPGLQYIVVNEAGASVYSASKLAAQEFPEFDVSLRSAASIARRLQDPLAELVKIDPKSIGVGQYQHDMPPKELQGALGGVVEDCVNAVGVDVNTASASLLSHVAGISAPIAKNIVSWREKNGPFPERSTLKNVPKLGPKAFEQCAGFLRVPESRHILDNTHVHPESYKAAETLLSLCGYTKDDVKYGRLGELPERTEKLGKEEAARRCGVGLPTLTDIISELIKPGRDVRDSLPLPMLRTDVMDMNDLKPGMQLTGTVRNVVDFGAFVDIGVHQDGLVHISQISSRHIRHPSEALRVGDIIEVWVIECDPGRKRISLTMKKPPGQKND
ncbi:MAG: RNA-binding transcriptional accessory protein [Oscillospiraceae bacterium]|nr:RNA-binding transcriptional accessory protein [Oscillospiraceae bacterium]